MNLEEIDEWAKSKPFTPFRITLTNGRTFEINDSSEFWPGKSNVLIIVPDPDLPGHYKTHATVSLLHIATIEPLHAVSQ